MTRQLGVVTVVLLVVIGLLGLWLLPVLVGGMCGASIYRERRRAETEAAVLKGASWPDERRLPSPTAETDPMLDLRTDALIDQEEAAAKEDLEDHETTRNERSARQAAAREEAELDRILEKIATEGLESLNRREQRLLAKATERRRDDP
jgi:hypothetical protein